MALDDKLYCIDKFKILKNLKDMENCVATNKQTNNLRGQTPTECYM